MEESPNKELLDELHAVKQMVDQLQKKIPGHDRGSTSDDGHVVPPDLHEIRDILGSLIDKQNKMESTFGVEKVSLRDGGDRIVVTIDTTFGSVSTYAEKGGQMPGGTHSPVTYSGSTVAGAGGPAPGVGGGKGGGGHGMTPEQLQEFKKQTLQIGAAQQKLKELETKLTEATTAIKRGNEKTVDMEEKEAENIKELYTCIDSINTSLSEKIALQKVEVQKIAGDQPKPINYDPFNYGEAYAGDLVDFQARKRITELKLLLQGLQTALLQMRDSMKVSPSIDLGYKVVRLDQLVGSTGFGQKVQNGEVGQDEALLVEQSRERVPGKVEYPRKSMNQTSQEMESKWAITDSIMQTMYRLEMEVGELQKIVDKTGISSGSRVIEEVQHSIKQLKEKQIDIKTIKRLIEDARDSSAQANLMSGSRKSTTMGNPRSTLPQIHGESSDMSVGSSRKMDQTLRNMQQAINSLNRKVMGAGLKHSDSSLASSVTKRHGRGRHCLSCDRTVKGEAHDVSRPPLPMYSYFSPTGVSPRIRGPTHGQYMLNRTYTVDLSRDKPDVYSIPRPCGAGYTEYWPLPRSFDASRFQVLFEPPAMMNETKYIKGTDGRHYRAQTRNTPTHHKRDVPMSILEAKANPRNEPSNESEGFKVQKQDFFKDDGSTGSSEHQPVAVVVMAASDEFASLREAEEVEEEEKERERFEEANRRASLELKKYKFKMRSVGDDDADGGDDKEKENGKESSPPEVKEEKEEEGEREEEEGGRKDEAVGDTEGEEGEEKGGEEGEAAAVVKGEEEEDGEQTMRGNTTQASSEEKEEERREGNLDGETAVGGGGGSPVDTPAELEQQQQQQTSETVGPSETTEGAVPTGADDVEGERTEEEGQAGVAATPPDTQAAEELTQEDGGVTEE